MSRIPKVMRGLAAALLVAIPLLGNAGPARAASGINGGGSGFAALEIDQWRADTARAPYSLNVGYVAQGSSFGRQQFGSGNLDYGASDIQYPAIELPKTITPRCGTKGPSDCFAYVPVSAGGLAFMYNLIDSSGNRINNLKLTRDTACKIFTGAITKWSQLAGENPQLAGINRDIVPVIRADGAGESYVLSEFCLAVAPGVWNQFVTDKSGDPNVGDDFKTGKPVSNWPQNWGRSNPVANADGTANTVADPTTGKDAITYVAAGYAKVRNFPTASLQNAAGKFTQPDEDNVTVALGYATGNGDGTFKLDFTGADERSYFPSTYSYILAQTTGWDAGKGETLGKFLCYAVSKGQEIAPQLRYARLSKPLVDLAIAQIGKIPGAPGADACFIASAAPPPAPPSVAPGSATPPPSSDGGGTGDGGTGGSGGGGAGSTADGGTSTTSGGTATTAPGATATTVKGSTANPCSTTTTTTSTTAPGGTTTSSTASSTTTTVAGSSTSSSTTTTRPCTSASPTGTGNATDAALGTTGDGSIDLNPGNASSQSGAQNNSLWVLLAGAGLCAVATTAIDWRRGANR